MKEEANDHYQKVANMEHQHTTMFKALQEKNEMLEK